MGHHQCSYVDYDKAQELGAAAGMTQQEVKDAYYSSREITLKFASDNSWKFPAMLPLYLALGFRPEQAFIDDVMSGLLIDYDVVGSLGAGNSNFDDERRPSNHTKQELQRLIDEAEKIGGEKGMMTACSLSWEYDRAYGPKRIGYLQGEPLPPPDPSFSKAFITRLREVREEGRNLPEPSREGLQKLSNALDDFDPGF